MSGVKATSYRRPTSTQHAVLDELRLWIHNGRLQPGAKVLQEDVAEELGTSVVPVREALKTLQSEGLLVHHPNRGFFVTKLSEEELVELCAIRSALESLAVERALVSLDDDALAHMDELIVAMEDADKRDEIDNLIRLDRAFHFVLFTASNSPQLLRMIEMTWDQSDAYRSAFFVDPSHRSATHREHRHIVEATRNGDVNAVCALLDQHRLTPIQALHQEGSSPAG